MSICSDLAITRPCNAQTCQSGNSSYKLNLGGLNSEKSCESQPEKRSKIERVSEIQWCVKLLLMSGASEEPDGGLGVWASARCAAARLTGIGAIEFSRADEAAFASVSHQLGLISSTIHERRVHVGWGVCG